MGGSTQVVYQLSQHLSELGYQITICTSDYGSKSVQFPQGSFSVVNFSSLPTAWKFYITPGLIPWARRHLAEFDIIHLHNVRTFQNGVVASQARKIGIPYILSAHGSLPHLGRHEIAKRVFDSLFATRLIHDATRIVSVSEDEAAQFVAAGIGREKITTIYNGLNLADFSSLPGRGAFRNKYRISSDTKIILYLGRLHKIKRIEYLIEAFACLKPSLSDAVLVIAGPDDGELSNLRRTVAKTGVSQQVIFTGPLYGRDKLPAFVDADVLVSPGKYEIFGLVPFEAILCGTPVVVSSESSSGQLIRKIGAGYTAKLDGIEELCELIRHALFDTAENERKVTAGQQYIRDKLDWNSVVSRYIDLYQEVVSSGYSH